MRILRRGREQGGALGQVERVLVPLQRRSRPAEPGEDRVRRPLRASRRPAAPRPPPPTPADLRAERRGEQLHPEARAPERDAATHRPRRSAPSRRISQGCSASSLTLIGPPIATIASIPSRLAGSGSPSSSSTRCSSAPRFRRTSSNTPGGSQAMCCRTRTSTATVLRRCGDDRAARTSESNRQMQGARRSRAPCIVVLRYAWALWVASCAFGSRSATRLAAVASTSPRLRPPSARTRIRIRSPASSFERVDHGRDAMRPVEEHGLVAERERLRRGLPDHQPQRAAIATLDVDRDLAAARRDERAAEEVQRLVRLRRGLAVVSDDARRRALRSSRTTRRGRRGRLP